NQLTLAQSSLKTKTDRIQRLEGLLDTAEKERDRAQRGWDAWIAWSDEVTRDVLTLTDEDQKTNPPVKFKALVQSWKSDRQAWIAWRNQIAVRLLTEEEQKANLPDKFKGLVQSWKSDRQAWIDWRNQIAAGLLTEAEQKANLPDKFKGLVLSWKSDR